MDIYVTIYHKIQPFYSSIYAQNNNTQMFIGTLAKNQKWSKQLSTSKWINKLWYIYIMKYYLAKKKKRTDTSNKSNLKINFYAEWKQTKKVYIIWSHFCKILENAKCKLTHSDRNQFSGHQGRGNRLQRGLRKLLGVMDMFNLLIAMIALWVST